MIFTRRKAERIRTVFGRIFISTGALSSLVFIFMEIIDKIVRRLAGSDNDQKFKWKHNWLQLEKDNLRMFSKLFYSWLHVINEN